MLFDADDTIWVMDLPELTMWQVADVDLNYNRLSDSRDSMLRLHYGFHADVSPDGSSVVYSTCEYWDDRQVNSMALQAYEIAVVDIYGSERKRLTRAEGFVNYPSWSPDGEHIAIVAYAPGKDSQPSIDHYRYSEYGLQYDNSVDVALIAAVGELPQVEKRVRFQPPGPGRVALYAPVWSPSGRQLTYLAYEYENGEYLFTTAAFVVDIDGTGLARLGSAVSPPTWSPDGEELAFVSVEGSEVVVYAANPDGTGQREIWRIAGQYGQALWSPDGSEILVITDQAYLVSADGSEQRVISPNRQLRHAAWSADGSMIALRDEFSISLVSREGEEVRVLVTLHRNGQLEAMQSEATEVSPTATPTPAHAEASATPTE